MKVEIKKEFDAVQFMRDARDKISRDIADMTYLEIKAYLAKKRSKERIIPSS